MKDGPSSLAEYMTDYFVTDYGMIALPEKLPELPTLKYSEVRYDEYTGERYFVTKEYPDYSSPLGKQRLAYEDHLNKLAKATWGPHNIEAKIPAFSEWLKNYAPEEGCDLKQ